MTTPYGILN